MNKSRTIAILLALFVLGAAPLLAQQDIFARIHTLPYPIDSVGWGNVVAGVDLDGDGKTEIYAVSTDMYDTGPELTPPRIYKFEYDSVAARWDTVWSATLAGYVPKQNTWPALTVGDLDNDGKKEIIWGPPNNLDGTNTNPARVLVFEANPGQEYMGVPDGLGGYKPNSHWTITSTASFELRPFRWVTADVNGDGKQELVFCERRTGTASYKFGIASVTDIPDNGDGSETWTLLFSGKDSVMTGGTYYDIAAIDSSIFIFSTNGNVTPVLWRNGAFHIEKPQVGLVPGGSWKSSSVLDVDGDGTKEIVVAGNGGGGSTNNIYLLQLQGDTLVGSTIATANLGTGSRLFGGAYGDIDNDGNVDFVFGSRDATPPGMISRLKYLGGPITSSSSYQLSTVDQGFGAGGERYDILSVIAVPGDASKEVLYGQGYGGDANDPLVLLKRYVGNPIPISVARADTNHDFKPDKLGDTVQIIGVVNSINFTLSAGALTAYIQDDNAGIDVYKGGTITPTLNIGDKIMVRGKIAQYRGTTELTPFDLNKDIVLLATGVPLTPIDLTIDQYLANPESYEGRLIRFTGVAKVGTTSWPAADNNASLTITDGYASTSMFIDLDTDIDGSTEPAYPITVTGVAAQYTSSASVYNDGYEIEPRMLADITSGVQVPPNPHFALLSPVNGSSMTIFPGLAYDFKWRKAVDLNNDALLYQFRRIGATGGIASNNGGVDSVATLSGATLLSYMTGDSLLMKWTVLVKDPTNPAVGSKDTLTVTLKRGVLNAGWTANASLTTHDLYSVKTLNEAVAWAAGAAGVVLRTVDAGQTWTNVGGGAIGANGVYAIDAIDANTAFVTTTPGATTYLFRTTNAGAKWDTVYLLPGGFLDGIHMIDAMNGIAFGDPVAGKWVILNTSDGGATWSRIANEPTQQGTEAGWNNSFAYFGSRFFWFGTSGGRIYRTSDGGANWSAVTMPLSSVGGMAFIDTTYGIALLQDATASTQSLVRSTDGGSTWNAVTIPGSGVIASAAASAGKVDFWMGRGQQIFRSTNRGVTWSLDWNLGAGVNHASFVNYGASASGWVVGSGGAIAGDYVSALTGVNIKGNAIPETYALEQNYPNPFNPTTTIQYALPANSRVTLKIYNVLGQLVAQLCDEVQSAGTYDVVWDGKNDAGMKVSSGVYFYHLEANPTDGNKAFVTSKKMIMLK